jgi:teichuronic acid biosynthesis glycosyltransferase TuaC
MKLAIVSSYFPLGEQPYRGQTAYRTALELSNWMTVEAICPFTRYPTWFRPRNFPYFKPDPTFSPNGIKTTYLEYPALPGLTRFMNGLMCERYIEPYVRLSQPDVLQSYWLYPDGYAAVRVGSKLGIPVVLVAIGSDLNRIPDFITKYFTQKALTQADHVMTMSRYLSKKAVELGARPEKTSWHINGCDTNIFHKRDRALYRSQLQIDPESQLILYVGRLDLAKGLAELMQATASLLPRYPDLKLVLAGEGPALSPLRTLARQLKMDEEVMFLGACNSETIARWLGACDLFSLPSHSEGSPNVIIEALNCGRPVVATHVGGIPELVDDDAGILVPPHDAAALAQAFDAALQKTWDEEAIAHRFHRSWRDLALEMRSILESTVSAHSNTKRQL